MLAIQIAAGIVLAAIVLKFWRQSLWIAVGAVTAFLLLIVGLWFANTPAGRMVPRPTWIGGVAAVFWLVVAGYAIRQRAKRP